MPYTVNQVARMSGVSVRALRFYDETGLLKPAYYGDNGYRFYEEPQLLLLQQILYYRELGFGLRRIQGILGGQDFEKVAALESHRTALRHGLARTRALLETIDNTIRHLKGTNQMENQELFAGFHVGRGEARHAEKVQLGGEPNDCKVSGRDTQGSMSVFEFTGTGGGPRHLHHEQDEWIYVIEGEFDFAIAERHVRAAAGESVFLPRGVPHGWASANGSAGKIIDIYQPAGKMEEFFRELGRYQEPAVHEALGFEGLKRLFAVHGMKVTGPPIAGEWKVESDRIVRVSQVRADPAQ